MQRDEEERLTTGKERRTARGSEGGQEKEMKRRRSRE